MTTLTKTRIDIADRHSSLYFFKKKPGDPDPLGMGGSTQYQALYKTIAQGHGAQYQTLTTKPGAVLAKLVPQTPDDPDKPLKYWLWYLGRGPAPDEAWAEAIPLLAVPNHRLEILLPAKFPAKAKVSPVAQIVLYPFGWSTWISFLIKGAHGLEDLASLVTHVFQQNAIQISGAANPVSLSAYFALVAKGVRADAFGGALTRDRTEVAPVCITTVLEKNSGAPGVGGMGPPEEGQLQSLVRPQGPASDKLAAQIFQYKKSKRPDLNYLLSDQMGRFLWKEDYLDPSGPNQMRLECYHHNSLRSLLQAWHFYGLVTYSSDDGLMQQWSKSKAGSAKPGKPCPLDDDLESLLKLAFRRLRNFPYHNACLQAFFDRDEVKQEIAASRQEAVNAGLLPAEKGA